MKFRSFVSHHISPRRRWYVTLMLVAAIIATGSYVSIHEPSEANAPVQSEDDTIIDLGSGGGNAQSIDPNPWGCYGRVENPHESEDFPGLGHIQAKASIVCPNEPPSTWTARIEQRLYVEDPVEGFALLARKSSHCPSSAGRASCRTWQNHRRYIMQAYVADECTVGTTYIYGQVADITFTVNGKDYTGSGVNTNEEECEGP